MGVPKVTSESGLRWGPFRDPSKVVFEFSNLSSGNPSSVWVCRPKPRIPKTEVSKPEPTLEGSWDPIPKPGFRDRGQKAVRPIVGLGSKSGVWRPPFWASGEGPPGALIWVPLPNLGFRHPPGGCRKPHFSRFGGGPRAPP
jgi:hypothetical protein